MKFAPKFGVAPKRDFHFALTAIGLPLTFLANGPCRNRAAARLAGGIADSHFDGDGPVCDMRINLRVLNPNQWSGAQFDLANNAIPIALRVVADAMRVFADVDEYPIIHANAERVFSGRKLAENVLVRSC